MRDQNFATLVNILSRPAKMILGNKNPGAWPGLVVDRIKSAGVVVDSALQPSPVAAS